MTTTASETGAQRFVEDLELSGYGCVSNASFRLSPIHAFVGPNDSGKSTILRAVQTLLIAGAAGDGQGVQLLAGGDARWPASAAGEARIRTRLHGHSTWYELARQGGHNVERLERISDTQGREAIEWTHLDANQPGLLPTVAKHAIVRFVHGSLVTSNTPLGRTKIGPGNLALVDPAEVGRHVDGGVASMAADIDREAHELAAWIAPASLLRLDPDALRRSCSLIPRHARLGFRDERGYGLPGVLEAMRDRDEAGYLALRDRFLRMFPRVRSLHIPSISETEKSIEVMLHSGKSVPAALMSEGMLYFLAFLASSHADRAPVLLVEEPENGLHPSRIGEVMSVLREMSRTTQVLIATHSPLVVNELSGSEVTVVVRDEEQGTKGTLLQDTPGFEKRSKVYALGELWVSYANGTDEAPLLHGQVRM
ncbi:AAA family ATPase [Sorangium sp. So ce1151]|uniref:AAA family ATPase n=1 Tax=Sorangium sp. So ce1151 TaxID=3133332 RepID=UPI003F61BE3B